ncbi:MAG: methylated-DNA--protein-cysteine methyltransferase [Actinomycetota bacterium]|jgi:methylated-DNA-[protein]-cysteine S-methyltransferase
MSNSDEFVTTVCASPVGTLRLTASVRGLRSIEVVRGSKIKHETVPRTGAGAIVRQAEQELREYFAGRRRTFTVKLDLEGTEFQRKAWQAMRKIPFGETISYGDQARKVGKPKAYRAVGSANGKNPIPIIVPCHRVLASDGSLGGYSLGLSMKRRLLALEGVSVAG